MLGDNKIAIPWYRKNVMRSISDLDEIIADTASNNVNRLRTRTRTRPRPIMEPEPSTVRVPVTSTVMSPVTNPIFDPVLSPMGSPMPNPMGNPFENPMFPNPLFPAPFPPFKPDTENKKTPFPDKYPFPMPKPAYVAYTDEQTSWGDNFIKQVEIVAYMSGVTAKEVYTFMRDYDYENLSVSDFNQSASDQFGGVAATILTVLIVGKSVIGMWGKRATNMFTPPIDVKDDYFRKHFGTDIEA